MPYSKDDIKENFYKANNCNEDKELNIKEQVMRKDGNEILFFKVEDFLNAKLVEYTEDGNIKYHYDKMVLDGQVYDIMPGMLLGVEFTKRNINPQCNKFII